MRISDLSRQTGVPIATIKFYLREHLLPPGNATCRNQAEYGEEHVRRLRMIRVLTSIGQFELSSVREVLSAVDDDQLPLADLYDVASRAMMPPEPTVVEADGLDRALADVDALVDDLGWAVHAEAPARRRFAQVVAASRRLGCEYGIQFYRPFAEAAERMTANELALLPARDAEVDRAAALVRTVLLDIALASLRRMAHEHFVSERLGRAAPTVAGPDSGANGDPIPVENARRAPTSIGGAIRAPTS